MQNRLKHLVEEMLEKGLDYDDARQALERQFITSALNRSNGSRGRAANLLGMHRNTLSRKVSEYNLKRQL
ncbi:MAG: helix-turn-helix domain-containing protein [Acidobacteriota bacterium]|nr:helix-turn-helix domain-containing protein [Acidobacteriota bacterium]